MPQADLYYSEDLNIDAKALLGQLEAVIWEKDAGSGECKGRAHPVQAYHHTHVLLVLKMMDRPHRTEAFLTDLSDRIAKILGHGINQPCALSVSVEFLPKVYISELHKPS